MRWNPDAFFQQRDKCRRKRAFNSTTEANDAVYVHRMQTGETKNVYKCGWCGKYHLTSS